MISVYIHIFSSVLLSSITLGPASSKRWSASIKSKPHHWPSWNHCGSRFKFMAKKPGFCESEFGRQSKCLHFADFKAFQTCLVIIRNYLGFLNLVFLRSLFIFDSSILNKKNNSQTSHQATSARTICHAKHPTVSSNNKGVTSRITQLQQSRWMWIFSTNLKHVEGEAFHMVLTISNCIHGWSFVEFFIVFPTWIHSKQPGASCKSFSTQK